MRSRPRAPLHLAEISLVLVVLGTVMACRGEILTSAVIAVTLAVVWVARLRMCSGPTSDA